jgi:aspartyl-tRNA(Asn)/glutamyl-tRNA(Gln) amidotransferase subunit B
MPELPVARAARFERELGLSAERAYELATRTERADYFEAALDGDGADPVAVANWISQLVERIGPDTDPMTSNVTPAALARLVAMVGAKEVGGTAARDVLTMLVAEGGDPRAIVAREGLGAISAEDSGLAEIVARALAADPDAAAKVRAGNLKPIGALVGFVMRETKGRADGGEVRRLILEQVSAVVSHDDGTAELVRELPVDASLVIMRRPIAGG